MAGVFLSVVISAIVIVLAAIFRRRALRAGGISLGLGVALVAVGAMFNFSLAAILLFEGVAALAAIGLAGRREQEAPAFQASPTPRTGRWGGVAPVFPIPVPSHPQSASGEPPPLPPIDEKQFLAWLKGRGLLNKSHTPEEMMDLRRQFLGMA